MKILRASLHQSDGTMYGNSCSVMQCTSCETQTKTNEVTMALTWGEPGTSTSKPCVSADNQIWYWLMNSCRHQQHDMLINSETMNRWTVNSQLNWTILEIGLYIPYGRKIAFGFLNETACLHFENVLNWCRCKSLEITNANTALYRWYACNFGATELGSKVWILWKFCHVVVRNVHKL